MKKTSRSRPARKAAVKKAARSKAATTKPKAKAKAPAPRKPAKPRKPAAQKSAARKTGARKASAPKSSTAKTSARKARLKKTGPDKATAIERASLAASQSAPAAPPGEDTRPESPALAALEAALLGPAPGDGPIALEAEPLQDLHETAAEAGRATLRRAGASEAGPDSAENPARVNKLVPTNAVHTTKRRTKRHNWQGPTVALAALAAVLAILVLGQESTPPDMSPLEQRASTLVTDGPLQGPSGPRTADPLQAAPEAGAQLPEWPQGSEQSDPTAAEAPDNKLKVLELVEMERMLQRLDMGPTRPDGIVDEDTVSAIRMYQQIAGLPVDGEPTRELLNDMREVVKLLGDAE